MLARLFQTQTLTHTRTHSLKPTLSHSCPMLLCHFTYAMLLQRSWSKLGIQKDTNTHQSMWHRCGWGKLSVVSGWNFLLRALIHPSHICQIICLGQSFFQQRWSHLLLRILTMWVPILHLQLTCEFHDDWFSKILETLFANFVFIFSRMNKTCESVRKLISSRLKISLGTDFVPFSRLCPLFSFFVFGWSTWILTQYSVKIW